MRKYHFCNNNVYSDPKSEKMSEREQRLRGELHSNDMTIEGKIEWLIAWKKLQSSEQKVSE